MSLWSGKQEADGHEEHKHCAQWSVAIWARSAPFALALHKVVRSVWRSEQLGPSATLPDLQTRGLL
jgi:hypothetical protein